MLSKARQRKEGDPRRAERQEGPGSIFSALCKGKNENLLVVYINGMGRKKARTESENVQEMVWRPRGEQVKSLSEGAA